MKISFFNCSKYSKQSNFDFEVYLPLSLLPILYVLNQDPLMKFICFSLNLSNLNKADFNSKALGYLLNNMNELNKFFDEKNNFSLIKQRKVLKFKWITSTDLFDVLIVMPVVEMFLVKPNVKLRKYIEMETVIKCVIMRSTWHLHVINNLNKYKFFRKILNTCFSLHRKRFHKNCFVLDEPYELEPYDMINPSSFNFNFIYSKDNLNNGFFTFNSSCIVIHVSELFTDIKLNFNQTIIIEYLKNFYGDQIDQFIRKLLDIKADSI